MGSFLEAFHALAGPAGVLRFDHFMELALYHPEWGYYRRIGARVGTAPGTDFITASTSAPVFGELIAAAAPRLLGGANPADYTFVEIGSESEGGILAGVAHPFAAVRTVRLGQPLRLSGRCIVFSNELFDAQPFRRFVRREGAWKELGVYFGPAGGSEVEISGPLPEFLPPDAPDGYHLDAPTDASVLAESIARQAWTGLFLACDYGKSWDELARHTPQGTARAYRRHRQSNDLLAHPGEQDLTCHLCWDWLIQALERQGFREAQVEAQEPFFVHHSGDYIAGLALREASQFSTKKQSLLQLLHPSNLGRKFQVLHALR